MKDFFSPVAQKCGYMLYTGAHYTLQNMVYDVYRLMK